MSVVVFDLDGTLTDTEQLWDQVRRQVAAEAGLQWPEDATSAMMGMSTQEWSAYLVETVGLPVSAPDAASQVIDVLAQTYRSAGVPLLPGAAAAVQRLARNWRLGLASSSPRVLIDIAMDQLGITEVIEVSLSTEEIGGAGKPAPGVYLEACRRLGADPQDSLAVEDSANGIRSAHGAGMRVIAIPPHFNPPPPEVLELADLVVSGLGDLEPKLVAGLLYR